METIISFIWDLGSIPSHANNYIPQSGIEPEMPPCQFGEEQIKIFSTDN